MTIQETITLLNAGYTKADIDAMVSNQQPAPQPEAIQQPAPQPEAIQQPAPQPEAIQQPATPIVQQQAAPAVTQLPQPVAPTQPPAPQPVQLSPQQLQQLIQGVAVQTASGVVETPPTANDILATMFAEIAGTTNKED